MTETTQNISPKNQSVFPRSLLSVSRSEFGLKEDNPHATGAPLKLLVKDDLPLPLGLQGHVFIIAAAGSVDSPCQPNTQIVTPASDGTTPVYNGDGIVYRLDFNNLAEGVTLTSRLMKPPCYYADVATAKCPEYQQPKDYRFINLGILRFSSRLGARNQINTAFLPMKFSDEEGYRLLATWDIGRPYEIDPQTLETVTPVGKNTEWLPMNPLMAQLPFEPPFPFPVVQSSAHPCFDFNTKQMFTVNSGRSLTSFIPHLRPLLYGILNLIDILRNPGSATSIFKQLYPKNEIPEKPTPQLNFMQSMWQLIKNFIHFLYGLFHFFNIFTNFVYILRWDGINHLQKWKVVLPNGCPLKIKQSMHQIGLTEDYIILVDTAFKTLVEELLPAVKQKKYQQLEKLLRKLTDYAQLPDTSLYIVRRDELTPDKKQVQAKKVIIPRETTHFIANYKNPNHQITLHLAHMSAWDVAEWIRDIDKSIFGSQNNGVSQELEKLFGVIVSPMDINRLACHVIDVKNPNNIKVIRSDLSGAYKNFTPNKYCQDNQKPKPENYCQYSWGPALFTCLDNPPTERIEDIYWCSLGCWQELLTEYSFKLYRDYKYREVPVEEVLKITLQGVPSSLLRLHIHPLENLQPNQNRLEIMDGYQFPDNYFGSSPQFIPRAGGNGGSTDGFIVCMVHYGSGDEPDNGNEIWIFDADNLKNGPICRLWHPELKMGFTVHTTWLPQIAKRTASYNIPVQEDYQDLVAQQPQLIQDLFNKWVYPQREP